jgi:hypothetical protein
LPTANQAASCIFFKQIANRHDAHAAKIISSVVTNAAIRASVRATAKVVTAVRSVFQSLLMTHATVGVA